MADRQYWVDTRSRAHLASGLSVYAKGLIHSHVLHPQSGPRIPPLSMHDEQASARRSQNSIGVSVVAAAGRQVKMHRQPNRSTEWRRWDLRYMPTCEQMERARQRHRVKEKGNLRARADGRCHALFSLLPPSFLTTNCPTTRAKYTPPAVKSLLRSLSPCDKLSPRISVGIQMLIGKLK